MKQLIRNYSYNQTAHTITFTDFASIRLDSILLITDITTGTILYQFNTSGIGASVATNILTLAAAIPGTANGDKLQIFYDLQAGDPYYDAVTQTTLASLIAGEDLTNNVLGGMMKPVVGSQYAPGAYHISATGTTANIKATSGNVWALSVTNKNTAVRYLQLHNTATTPSGGASAQWWRELLPGDGTIPSIKDLTSADFAPSEYFSTGIAWAVSTTSNTYTAATAADHNIHVRYS